MVASISNTGNVDSLLIRKLNHKVNDSSGDNDDLFRRFAFSPFDN